MELSFITEVQELLDEGKTRNQVAALLSVHHSKINRLVAKGVIEVYEAFDEQVGRDHLYQNFEWRWEEDWLEDMYNNAFDDYFILRKHKDSDLVAVGKYVRLHYTSLKEYFRVKNSYILQDFVMVHCPCCEGFTPLTKWCERKDFNWGLAYECPSCRRDVMNRYYTRYPEKVFEANNKRRKMANVLPGEYVKEDWVKVRKEFNWRCAFTTKVNSVTVDHFIPVSIGHGGTFEGNLVPILKRLNSSKNKKNPFEWAMARRIDKQKFNKVILYLAELNALTPDEYKEFVNWCFTHKRRYEVIQEDRRHSIEIWREATGRQFPLPKYALNAIGKRSTDETTVATVDKKEAK